MVIIAWLGIAACIFVTVGIIFTTGRMCGEYNGKKEVVEYLNRNDLETKARALEGLRYELQWVKLQVDGMLQYTDEELAAIAEEAEEADMEDDEEDEDDDEEDIRSTPKRQPDSINAYLYE